ncbi:hypothetical protein ROE7235_03904 [Roseibaca ekhonensis]|uniref:Uncharacterized protein n=1 Tax=Roseinatronobacter ekhonensis TaxID=254356 RepID=A0A3B0MEC3_9RHOB|nr:hypothetical protein ROE7235_03904 [Roseibaca ekhonensis]
MRLHGGALGLDERSAFPRRAARIVNRQEAAFFTARRMSQIFVLRRVDVQPVPQVGRIEPGHHAGARDLVHPRCPILVALELQLAGLGVSSQTFCTHQPQTALRLGRLADRRARIAFIEHGAEAAPPCDLGPAPLAQIVLLNALFNDPQEFVQGHGAVAVVFGLGVNRVSGPGPFKAWVARNRVAHVPKGALDGLGLAAIGGRPMDFTAQADEQPRYVILAHLEAEPRLRAARDQLGREFAPVIQDHMVGDAPIFDHVTCGQHHAAGIGSQVQTPRQDQTRVNILKRHHLRAHGLVFAGPAHEDVEFVIVGIDHFHRAQCRLVAHLRREHLFQPFQTIARQNLGRACDCFLVAPPGSVFRGDLPALALRHPHGAAIAGRKTRARQTQVVGFQPVHELGIDLVTGIGALGSAVARGQIGQAIIAPHTLYHRQPVPDAARAHALRSCHALNGHMPPQLILQRVY